MKNLRLKLIIIKQLHFSNRRTISPCVNHNSLISKPKLKVDKPPEIELVNLNKQKTEEPLEDYIMTIGIKNEVVKCSVPDWVVKEYNKTQ